MKYKLRAEHKEDIDNLLALLPKDRVGSFLSKQLGNMGDTEAMIELESISFEELKGFIRMVKDGHVMLQTVQSEENYTGKRDYQLI